jgi:phosphopantothenoylcysteine decarboxylase/phosphopantothenate--cysteine ligase
MGVEGKRIVLGVSGGIAAYKAVELCRRLVDAGAHVVPVLTEGALHFVGRTTFDALASERAWTSLWDEQHPIPHTHLGQTADLVLVAPATARVLGLYAAGISDDLLLNTLIATRAPVVVCPAMHTEMWEHPAVQDNLRLLRSRGVHVVEPGVGRLAGGDVGAGRLAEPEEVLAAVDDVLAGSGSAPQQDLAGVRAVVTAGGTREPIDPVRFIGNRSSGKQGHAVAEEAAARGAKVTLVTTTSLPTSAGIDVVRVDTASEMEQAVLSRSDDAQLIVMAAAVADFRPVRVADSKIKKAGGLPDVALEPTTDILAALGARRRPGQTIVGFAAETDDLRANAAEKLARKGIDLIVANDVSAPGVGFEHDTNAVVILDAAGGAAEVPLTDKRAIARAILDAVSTSRSDP